MSSSRFARRAIGIIIVDDYFAWDGCTRSVHGFPSSTNATERIRHTRRGQVAFIEKHGTGV
jgi:O-methyltransferase